MNVTYAYSLLRNVLPRDTPNDLTDARLSGAEPARKFVLRDPCGVQAPHFSHLIFGEARTTVSFTPRPTFRVPVHGASLAACDQFRMPPHGIAVGCKAPSFLHHIRHIGLMGAEEEVIRTHAMPDIAPMENLLVFWQGAVVQFPREAMRWNTRGGSAASSQFAVASHLAPGPQPTRPQFWKMRGRRSVLVNKAPEPFFQRNGRAILIGHSNLLCWGASLPVVAATREHFLFSHSSSCKEGSTSA